MPLHVVLWAIALLATVALTLVRGGPPERIAAFAFLIAWIASYMGVGSRNIHPQWAIMAADGLYTLVLIGVFVVWRRIWAAVAAGFFIFGLVLHGIMIADPQRVWLGYLPGLVAVSYCTLAAIAVGVLVEQPRAGAIRRR